jgi:hypothetical protein
MPRQVGSSNSNRSVAAVVCAGLFGGLNSILVSGGGGVALLFQADFHHLTCEVEQFLREIRALPLDDA